MKIVYLVHQFFPEYQTGTEKFVFNSAYMAQKNGNNVKIITYSSYDNSFYEQEKNGIFFTEFTYNGIHVIAFKYHQLPTHLNIVLHSNLLFGFARAVMKHEKPDLVIVGHLMRVHEFLWAAIEMQIPYTITMTDFFLLCPKINLSPNKLTLCLGPNHGATCADYCQEFNQQYIRERISQSEELLKNASSLIAPSKFVASVFKQEFSDLEIEIIPHGIRYLHTKKNNRSYDIGDKLIFAYIGNSFYHKGLHILLTAFRQLMHKNIALRIFGFEKEYPYHDLGEITNNDDRIIFAGGFQAEHLGNIFENLDILIIPSICYETYSFVLHEALACNVPVIASNLGAIGEEVHDRFNGFLFKPGNADHLQETLELIIENPSIINTIKKNIYLHCIVPTVEQEAYQYFKLFNKILDGRNH